jgi:predicted Zn-ribbon and HTH transcriptional regulator
MKTEEKAKPVCVTECERCGRERIAFKAIKSKCPRCDSTDCYWRWISNPHPDTTAKAKGLPNG